LPLTKCDADEQGTTGKKYTETLHLEAAHLVKMRWEKWRLIS